MFLAMKRRRTSLLQVSQFTVRPRRFDDLTQSCVKPESRQAPNRSSSGAPPLRKTMTKNAKKSQLSRSSRASASAKAPKTASNDKMVLRVKSSEGMKRSARLSRVSAEEKRPGSAKKPKTKQKKKNDKFDAKKPKKPPTAFFFFLEDFRKEFQEQNPDVKSMRDIGKACGEKWKTMTYEEKVQYYDIATEKRAEFDRATAEYIKKKESGEDQETEDSDSEFDE
ncbi:high mobility group B protein 14 [Corylus avellana]|uniref:high mobility group B protein 14 n=1 Tax=Corylus avellana TaxID=13451 RepID=UPI00286C91FC|nr:high mobility group B protein 14 [Corylus avellana]